MTETARVPKTVQLLAQPRSGDRERLVYERMVGGGEPARSVILRAQAQTRYELLEPKTGKAPEHVRAKRSGQDLEIFLDGSETADFIIEAYYDEALVPTPQDSLTGLSDSGRLLPYVIDEGLRPALTSLASQSTPIILADWAVGLSSIEAAGAGAAAVLLPELMGGGSGMAPIGKLLITGKVVSRLLASPVTSSR